MPDTAAKMTVEELRAIARADLANHFEQAIQKQRRLLINAGFPATAADMMIEDALNRMARANFEGRKS